MRGRDIAWAAVAVLMLVNAVLGVVAVGLALSDADVWRAARGALGLVVAYWVGMGAWRRTTWGRPCGPAQPSGP